MLPPAQTLSDVERPTGRPAGAVSPADPFLTPDDYRECLAALNLIPTFENRPARERIKEYLDRRAWWQADARTRKLENPL